ncbi:MAG TPA: hypothetical protein VMY78_07700 [Solirubrobacteraceae bacterium]|nr:hypothetical protein [Solirubrobacteraceae bacterium]
MRRPSALLPLLGAVACLALLAVPASAAAPAATGLPAITGTARQGQILTSTTGAFSGTAPITTSRAWQRCDAGGAACAPIASASAATYTLAAADVGTTIRVSVTATNLEGSATVSSPASALVGALSPPVNDAGGLPVISGTARDGQTLSATDGGWSGIGPLTFTRLWRRCDAGGASCSSLAGAATHLLTSNDIGATIRVEVTAKNADGQAVATSAQTAVVDAAAPANTALPAVGGTARSGQTLTSANTGTWTGTVPMTFTRQWTRCDAGGGACVAIPGAIVASYVLTDDDIGSTIRLAVTATNTKSAATASSVASAAVGPRVPPVKTADPSVSGSPVDGLVLTASDGSWSGTPTITTTRRWQRCDAFGADCADLAGTGTTLTLSSADVGATIRLRVTATNPDGATHATSATTAVVAPAAPSSTAAPAVSGTAAEGRVLSATQGTWKGTPAIAFAYAWRRCAAAVCSAIAGATDTTYRLAAADVGKTVRVAVTATNAGGATTTASAATATVTGGAPGSIDLPAVSSALPRDGELHTATLGTWVGSAPLVHDRQWLRCNAVGAPCTAIIGEVADTYRATSADVGKTLRVEVTATNALGATKAQSAPTPVILAAPPVADGSPAIGGVLRDGQTLTATSGWSGTAPISLSHQWQRCDALAPMCSDIAGATAATYVLASADVGSRMRVRVGALNAGGGGSATSDLAVAAIVAPDAPRATAAPVLSGPAVEGSTLTSGDGAFSGTLPLTRSFRWQRCDGAGAGCADIAGATASGYVLTAADRGATLRAVVTAVNGSGSDSAASAVSAVVALAPPRNLVLPSVAPDTGLRDGATLTSTGGGWTGSLPMMVAQRWQRCKSVTDCADVPGAAGPSYMLTTSDAGFAMRIVVSASNGAGTTAQASALTGVVGTNPPVSVVAPAIAGSARDGDVLTAVDGVWTGPVDVQTAYEWWRCDPPGANCSIIAGATARSFVPGPANIGLSLRVRIVRTSSGGTTGAFSAPTATVIAAPPANLALPQIAGGAAVGKTLTTGTGTWTGTPALTFEYQWRRCAAGGSACTDIPGATAATYLATGDDAHASLRVVVRAANAVGSATATSAATLEVQTDPPVMLVAPAVTAAAGPRAVGTTLAAQPGTWGGAQPISFEFRWVRCDAALVACGPVAGATTGSYLLASADIGKRIAVLVTATNVVDSTTALADATSAVLPAPPASATPPAVSAGIGTRVGAKLTASTGTWNGATPLSYETSWLRCDGAGGGCAVLAGAGAASYTLTADDVGHRMRARVTATNATSSVSAESSPTAAVTMALQPPTVPPPPPAPVAAPRPTTSTPTTTTPKTTTTATTTGKPSTGKTGTTTAGETGTTTGTHTATTRPIAGLARLRLTPGGRLVIGLRCPAYRQRACAAKATVVAGTALSEPVPDTTLRFALRAVTVPNAKTRARTLKLSAAQLEELEELTAVRFRVRLSPPAGSERFIEVWVRARVPEQLRTGSV